MIFLEGEEKNSLVCLFLHSLGERGTSCPLGDHSPSVSFSCNAELAQTLLIGSIHTIDLDTNSFVVRITRSFSTRVPYDIDHFGTHDCTEQSGLLLE